MQNYVSIPNGKGKEKFIRKEEFQCRIMYQFPMGKVK